MILRNTRGSLLVNLGIAFVLILFIVTISVPRITFMRRFLLRTEIEKLHAMFHYLQERALVINEDQMLMFDIEHQCYFIGDRKEQLPQGIIFGFLPNTAGPPSKPIKPITHAVTFKNNKATFYADGTIAAGTVYLTDLDRTSMYALTSPISQISFLRTYRYYKGSWVPLT